MRFRRIAMLGALALSVAPAIQAWPGSMPSVSAATPAITLLSTSQWSEPVSASPPLTAWHLVGEVRNDTGANVTSIHLQLNLFDTNSQPDGQTSADTTLRVLAPGERSPFETVLDPAPANFGSFTVTQPIGYALSPAPPDHQFTISPDTCSPSPDCQNFLSGGVTNPSTAPKVNGVIAVFTFYDSHGHIVAQNQTEVLNTNTGTQTLAPSDTGRYNLNRWGDPGWVTDAIVVEPDYPIDVNPVSVDFGRQRLSATSSPLEVNLYNGGPDAVTLTHVSVSGNFALAATSCSVIPSGSNCRLSLTFTPHSIGSLTGALTVSHTAAGSPISIPLSGTGVAPAVGLSTHSVTFSPIAVGTTSSPQPVTLTNTGNDTLHITSIVVTGDFAASQCPSSIDPQAQCVISVTFTPQSGGLRSGALTITDDAADTPQTVSLSGTGLGPGVAFTPATLDFGAVSVGSTSPPTPAQLSNAGSAPLAITSIASGGGDFNYVSDNCPRSPATLAAGNHCAITMTFSPTNPGLERGSLIVTDNAGDSPQAYGLLGTGAQATYSASITSQPRLNGSDGATWQPIDPQLTLTIKPSANETALLSGNADLWTATAGVNQDIGITASVGGGPDTLVLWKESGGFAGTFSPNAAFVHGRYDMLAGFTYVFKLVWKANHPTNGSIFAGAGPIGAAFSPTRITAQLVDTGVTSAAITSQPQLAGNDGATWSDIGSGLTVQFTGSLGTSALIAGNADLWTATAGVNQDLGIFVTPPGQSSELVAWKESGGSAGIFSPNAAYVQAIVPTPSSGTYTVSLRWKTNINAPSASIFAGAGPINGKFSPTTLTVQLVDNGSLQNSVTHGQPRLSGSDGSSWAPLSSLSVPVASSSNNAIAVVGANADLWTDTTGYNQDLGIFISVDGAAPVLVSWKESGGFAGIFSPNAAFAQAVVPLPAGHSYTFTLQWKTNRAEGPATIAAGAGPIGQAFSPTSLAVQVLPN